MARSDSVKIALVLVDGFNLYELSRTLAIFNVANRLSYPLRFDITVLTLDDRFAASNWDVGVVPTSAVCSAGLQDYMMICMGDRPTDDPTILYSNLRHIASDGGLINLIASQYSAPEAFVANTLAWLIKAVQGSDTQTLVRLERAINANRLYLLNTAVVSAVLERFCGPEIADEIVRQVCTGTMSEAEQMASKRRPKRLDDAIHIMLNHLHEPLSAREIGRRVGCSSRQLLRWFDAHLSMTAAQYYSMLRLERGRHLLFHSDMSITEIAVACGYVWVAQFSKAYRKRYGQSPRLARKENQLRLLKEARGQVRVP